MNFLNKFYQIQIGDRIVHFIFEKISTPVIEEVYEFDNLNNERGVCGFGLTTLFKIDFLDFKSLKMSRKVDNKYITPYENLDISWYECGGILTYIDQLKYKEFTEGPDKHFTDVKIIIFDIIHHECSGKPPGKFLKHYKIICNEGLKSYPKNDKTKALSADFVAQGNTLVEKKLDD